METYNVDYFIKKFEAIPEEKWCIGAFHIDQYKSCALGHCGIDWHKSTPEGSRFKELVLNYLDIQFIYMLNDGVLSEYQQPTPKQRILAALYDIKAKQQPEPVKEIEPVKERTVYVTVDAAVRKLQKEISEN